MASTLERIETSMGEARKQLDRAVAQREAAVAGIIKAAGKVKEAQRTVARLEKRRVALKAEERAARKAATQRRAEDGPVPAL